MGPGTAIPYKRSGTPIDTCTAKNTSSLSLCTAGYAPAALLKTGEETIQIGDKKSTTVSHVPFLSGNNLLGLYWAAEPRPRVPSTAPSAQVSNLPRERQTATRGGGEGRGPKVLEILQIFSVYKSLPHRQGRARVLVPGRLSFPPSYSGAGARKEPLAGSARPGAGAAGPPHLHCGMAATARCSPRPPGAPDPAERGKRRNPRALGGCRPHWKGQRGLRALGALASDPAGRTCTRG